MTRATKRTLRLVTSLATFAFLAELAAPRPGEAVQLDMACEIAAGALISGDERLQFNVIGQTSGSAGMLANLACFVGDPRCSCLRSATESDSSRSTEFANRVGALIAACQFSNPNRSLSGISQEAVLDICR